MKKSIRCSLTSYLHFPSLGRIKDHLTIRFRMSKTHMLSIRGHFDVSRKNTRVGRLAARSSVSHVLNFFPDPGPMGWKQTPSCPCFCPSLSRKREREEAGCFSSVLFASLSPKQNPRVPEIQRETVICVINQHFY